MKNNRLRAKIIECVVIVLVIPYAAYLIGYSAVFPGMNDGSDTAKQKILLKDDIEKTIEGSIVDNTEEPITQAEKEGIPAVCLSQSYGALVGYNSPVYGISGLRARYSDYLFKRDRRTHKGSTIKLTTLNEVQERAYRAIKGTDGTAIVIENKTGRIIALASTNKDVTIDVNDLSNWNQIVNHDGSLIPNWEKASAPGSVIKVASSALIICEGLQQQIYHDTGREIVSGHSFVNYEGHSYGNVNLCRGLVKSVNTYYAHMETIIGTPKLRSCYESFCIGGENAKIALDFCDITSDHGLKNSDEIEAAAAAFGQGKLMLTPIQMAMIGQCVANGGVMMKPYIVDKIYTVNGKTSYKGENLVLSTAVDSRTADEITKYMKEAGESYGFPKGIAAKTGTAEIGSFNRASILAFNDKYTVLVVEDHTHKKGKQLVSAAKSIFNVL